MPEECTLFQIGKLDSTPLNYGQHDSQTCNGSNNQSKIIVLHIKYVKMCKFLFWFITPIYKSEEYLHHAAHNECVNLTFQFVCLEQSALFWFKQLDIALAKLMFLGKLLIRWEVKIVKIIKIFEKLEPITHLVQKDRPFIVQTFN